VGALLRRNLNATKKVNETTRHDIKLELDVRCQRLIERVLRQAGAGPAVLGEEGIHGNPNSPWRWVVDPIDGTVNYSYGIPHACISIAFQGRNEVVQPLLERRHGEVRSWCPEYQTVVGVVYDPFVDELWTAVAGGEARLNGKPVAASSRRSLAEAIITVGFAKHRASLTHMLPIFTRLLHRVRKLRIMGSAALGLTYVATGRFDGYVESGVRLWDIAAGGLILESAGGTFWAQSLGPDHSYQIAATNRPLHKKLRPLA
jgi:myo-inositol-1(or 4)-monophosphatase